MGSLEPGSVLHGRYKVAAKVGQGAMAEVFSGVDQQSGRRVAIKQMGLYVDSDEEKQLAIAQFEHEAQLLHSLQHPNIPRVYEWFEDGHERFLIMDFVDGEVLSRKVDIVTQRDAAPTLLPSPVQVVDWALQLTEALVYLHGQRPKPIIYKDLKPDNLMVTPEGRIMLLDFGIAKGRDEKGQYKTILKGMVTPGYGAPEQYSGVATDPRTDLYGLGATMYALLTGHIPPAAIDRHEAIYARQRDPLLAVRQYNPAVSPALEILVMRLLALKREHRLASAEQVLRELRGLPEHQQKMASAASGKTGGGHALWWVAIFLLLAAVGAGAAWYFTRPHPPPEKPKPKHSYARPSHPRSASGSARSGSDRTGGGSRSDRRA
jgi:serine/threonine protein kinase